MSQLSKHNMPRTQGFQPLACSCASARRSRALCDLPPPDVLSYSVSKGWPNKSCILLGKSVLLGHRQSREREYRTADFASSFPPFWLWYPWWEKGPPSWVPLHRHQLGPTVLRLGRATGTGKVAVNVQGSQGQERHMWAAAAFLSPGPEGQPAGNGGAGELSWSHVRTDEHTALPKALCVFPRCACFTR